MHSSSRRARATLGKPAQRLLDRFATEQRSFPAERGAGAGVREATGRFDQRVEARQQPMGAEGRLRAVWTIRWQTSCVVICWHAGRIGLRVAADETVPDHVAHASLIDLELKGYQGRDAPEPMLLSRNRRCCHRSSGTGTESQLVGERATRSAVMNRRIAAALVMSTALCPLAVPAHAGPCTERIAQFEKAVRESARNPSAGPTASQSIGAQLGHQPTPSSVKRADLEAQTTFNAALARAKTLDAEGRRKCAQALAHAKRLSAFNSSWPTSRTNGVTGGCSRQSAPTLCR